MATNGGGYCRTWPAVMPRKVVSRPTSIAAHHVERARENTYGWIWAIRWAMVLIGREELVE
jgi:hypothetical protein